ncbi:MAG: 50S ribosomal protein L13 [Candidatus Gracilibacteria bacterium]|jgi:large subunit ribosomal protein L13
MAQKLQKKTFAPKKEEVIRKWYLIDAKDQVVGRLAVTVAQLLRGKGKNFFSPSVDCGDFVIVINVKDVKFTGDKMNQKLYRHHSGYKGGLKETNATKMMERKPSYALLHAVKGMIPRNNLRTGVLKKLHLYADDKHPHEAQKPEIIKL